ncbi:MAG: hypothetical protein WC847_02990 [Candidatus Paceibacterota bacterium]|jgi:hypothetical protein
MYQGPPGSDQNKATSLADRIAAQRAGNPGKLKERLAHHDQIFKGTPKNVPAYKVESNYNIEQFRVLAKKTIDENHSEDSSTPEKKAEAIERLAQSMLSLAISKMHRPYKVE